MNLTEIILLLVFAFAAVLHGITGMAFPMIGTSALALTMPLPKAVAMMILPSLLMNIMVLLSNRSGSLKSELAVYAKDYWRLIVLGAIGSVVGVKLLLWLPAVYLYAAMAIFTAYYALHGWASEAGKIRALNVPNGKNAMMIFGFLAGVVGGATNVMSPLVLMFLFAYTHNKHEIAKVSNLCYLVGKLVQLALLGAEMTALSLPEMAWLLAMMLVSLGFVVLGARWRSRLSQKFFKKLIYFVLLILSAKMGYSAMQFI